MEAECKAVIKQVTQMCIAPEERMEEKNAWISTLLASNYLIAARDLELDTRVNCKCAAKFSIA